MGKSLTERTTSGVTWSVLEGLSNQGITFLVGLVLARLLTPEEYGLVGIITIFIAVFLAVVDSGLSSALIREKNSSELDYCLYFIFYILVPKLGYLLEFLLNEYFSSYYWLPYYYEHLIEFLEKYMIIMIIDLIKMILES